MREDVTLLQGDCRQVLTTLGAASVHCVITSPPYWGLRQYIADGAAEKAQEIGLEPSLEEHVAALVGVFKEVWRVLRDDGTLFLNLGDAYSSGGRESRQANGKNGAVCEGRPATGFKPKDLLLMPFRIAMALQAQGWYLRSAITICKPSPMPESVTDRCTSATEMLFLLTKKPIYYYDAVAIAEPCVSDHGSGNGFKRQERLSYQDGDGARGNDEPWLPGGKRNKRNWWVVNSQALKEAHFAAFPEKLVEPCILAGTSEWGCCGACGAPWTRVVETIRSFEIGSGKSGRPPVGKNGVGLQGGGETADIRRGPCVSSQTTGWQPSCTHDAPVVPGVVLDPFAGSGTVSRVATRLGRRSIAIELKPEYCEIIERRNAQLGLLI